MKCEVFSVSSAVIAAVALSLGYACSSDHDPHPENLVPTEVVSAAEDAGTAWSGARACDICLQSYCGTPDSGLDEYRACENDASCRAVMSSFFRCYSQSPSLTACDDQIAAVRLRGQVASSILDCYLLTCFPTLCEKTRKLAR